MDERMIRGRRAFLIAVGVMVLTPSRDVFPQTPGGLGPADYMTIFEKAGLNQLRQKYKGKFTANDLAVLDTFFRAAAERASKDQGKHPDARKLAGDNATKFVAKIDELLAKDRQPITAQFLGRICDFLGNPFPFCD